MSYHNGKKGAFNIEGFPGVSDVYQVTSSGAPYTFWNKWFKPRSNLHTTLIAAEAALTGGINEVVLLSPESHSLASMLTWDKSNSALIGESPEDTFWNHRSRLGMSANFATMMTISGSGNLFKNLYFMHGRGSATNVNCLTVSGDRNVFKGVHVCGPQNNTESGTAGYDLVRLSGAEETVFKRCVFGNYGENGTTLNHIEFQSDCGNVLFEDCLFMLSSNGAGNTFLKFDAGLGIGVALFKNCQFINIGTACTVAFDTTGLNNYHAWFDTNCSIIGATDVGNNNSTQEAAVHFATPPAWVTAENVSFGLTNNYNHTA